jgi:hypothetical protein
MRESSVWLLRPPSCIGVVLLDGGRLTQVQSKIGHSCEISRHADHSVDLAERFDLAGHSFDVQKTEVFGHDAWGTLASSGT